MLHLDSCVITVVYLEKYITKHYLFLDPANENVEYTADIDIAQLIKLGEKLFKVIRNITGDKPPPPPTKNENL